MAATAIRTIALTTDLLLITFHSFQMFRLSGAVRITAVSPSRLAARFDPIRSLRFAQDSAAPVGRDSRASGAGSIQELQEIVRCQLDLLVPPLGGAVMARNEAGAVEAAEVSVDEGVSSLGLV
jgi:hypothetical protein